MTTLPNMGLILPTRGLPGSGAWGDTEDANLQLEDAHDHSTGKGVKITPSGLNINADLPFSALWAPTQLHRVQFSAIAGSALPAGNRKSLFVTDGTGGLISNELYWLTSAGVTVQLTTGSALNVGAFVAGIGGDYAGVGAQLNYTDSSKTYDFKESTADSHGWARLQCGGIRLIEFNTTETFFVAQIAPAALASSYTMTWPTAVPGTTAVAQIDNTGQISFSNTIVNDLTMTANKNVIVSGTGEYKHGAKTLVVPAAAAWTPNIAGNLWAFNSDTQHWVSSAINDLLSFPIWVATGRRITQIDVWFQRAGGTLTFDFRKATLSTNVGASIASTTVASGTSLTSASLSAINYTLLATEQYQLRITAGAGSDQVFAVVVTYDN